MAAFLNISAGKFCGHITDHPYGAYFTGQSFLIRGLTLKHQKNGI